MQTQDYIISQARRPESISAISHTGPFNAVLGKVLPVRTLNPLMCTSYKVGAQVLPAPRPEDPRKDERAAILASITANDSDMLPRVRNGGGDHKYLQQFTAPLMFWRRMANPPIDFGMWAANDNAGEGLNAENERELASTDYVNGGNPLPMEAESYLAMLPTPVRVCVRTARNRIGGEPGQMTTHYDWHPDDVEYVEGGGAGKRLKRLGRFEFATVDNDKTKDKLKARTVDKGGRPRDYLVSLGSVVAHTKDGRRKLVGQDNSRDRPSEADDAQLAAAQSRAFYKRVLGGPKDARGAAAISTPRKVQPDTPPTGPLPPVTYCPPGLPRGPTDLSQLFQCIGSNKAGQKTGVRRPVDMGCSTWDAKGDETAIARFRAANDNHAKVLDACMVAANLTDIAAVVGKSSPHTGSKKLGSACIALIDFLQKDAG